MRVCHSQSLHLAEFRHNIHLDFRSDQARSAAGSAEQFAREVRSDLGRRWLALLIRGYRYQHQQPGHLHRCPNARGVDQPERDAGAVVRLDYAHQPERILNDHGLQCCHGMASGEQVRTYSLLAT